MRLSNKEDEMLCKVSHKTKERSRIVPSIYLSLLRRHLTWGDGAERSSARGAWHALLLLCTTILELTQGYRNIIKFGLMYTLFLGPVVLADHQNHVNNPVHQKRLLFMYLFFDIEHGCCSQSKKQTHIK